MAAEYPSKQEAPMLQGRYIAGPVDGGHGAQVRQQASVVLALSVSPFSSLIFHGRRKLGNGQTHVHKPSTIMLACKQQRRHKAKEAKQTLCMPSVNGVFYCQVIGQEPPMLKLLADDKGTTGCGPAKPSLFETN